MYEHDVNTRSENRSEPVSTASSRILALFDDPDFIVLDGAMGTMIQKADLPSVRHPELYNITHPDAIHAIHKAYLNAGSDIIYANTFGASPSRFAEEEYSFEEVIQRGIELAKEAAAPFGAKVALDLGPLGVLMEPMGSFTFEQAYDEYAAMVKAGAKAGAVLVVIETMSDLQETRAALLAVKENSSLPVMVTMTFEENGRTFSGTSIEAAALTLEGLGADAIGLNCSLGPEQLAPLAARFASCSSLPIVVKPNMGLPNPLTGQYHLSDDDFTAAARKLVQAGARILGGCCGTTPSTIEKLSQMLSTQKPIPSSRSLDAISSARQFCLTDQIHVVGERINPTGKKRLQAALLEGDLDYVARLAIEQKEAGADLLDVNVGHPGVDEVEMLPEVIRTIQSVCDLPLLLDSSNPQALEVGLRIACGLCAINSVNGSEKSLNAILPLAQKYGCPVVALCLDENGIPETVEGRLEIADRIARAAAHYGIRPERIWFDALTLTVSAQQDQAPVTLQTITELRRRYPSRTILGVSNISFGLPQRQIVTQTFLAAALQAGLNFAIINPSLAPLMDTIRAFNVLAGYDEGSRTYIEHYAQAASSTPVSRPSASASKAPSLEEAIYKGLEQEAASACKALLAQGVQELEITSNYLIPALDRTGTDYEKGILYLPSLLQAASAAQAVFEVIRQSLASSSKPRVSRGTVVLATVHGDIHDIGKNIVKTLLENYGFTVIDLGRDVPAQKVFDTVKEKNIRMVGLSALMTTTLPAMKETIELLHTLENPPKIVVGGAVLTQEAADSMKADWYAKDARQTVQIAEAFFEGKGAPDGSPASKGESE